MQTDSKLMQEVEARGMSAKFWTVLSVDGIWYCGAVGVFIVTPFGAEIRPKSPKASGGHEFVVLPSTKSRAATVKSSASET